MSKDDAEKISLEGTISLATTTLRSVFVLNGAAAISLLTYVGNSSPVAVTKLILLTSMEWFVMGLITCVIAMIFAYFTQQEVTFRLGCEIDADQAEDIKDKGKAQLKAVKHYRAERRLTFVAVTFLIASLSSFSFGALSAANSLAQ